MKTNLRWFIVLFLSMTLFAASSLVSSLNSGRNLLQATKPCSLNFEFMNYTIITSQCKGPQYPPDRCCSSFKDFACPFVYYINDLTTDCATTMFSYINTYGNYPPGIFASLCREGKKGLACPAGSPSESVSASATLTMMLTVGFMALLLHPMF